MARLVERLDLILVQVKGVTFGRAEDAGGFCVQRTLRRQLIYRARTGISRADLQQEIQPQLSLCNQRLLEEIVGNLKVVRIETFS
jgi:hypothetical protein